VQVKDFIIKLRALPDNQKKIVMWAVVAVIAAILGIIWFNMSAKRVFQIQKSSVKLSVLPLTMVAKSSISVQ